jgi:hypothetical protein
MRCATSNARFHQQHHRVEEGSMQAAVRANTVVCRNCRRRLHAMALRSWIHGCLKRTTPACSRAHGEACAAALALAVRPPRPQHRPAAHGEASEAAESREGASNCLKAAPCIQRGKDDCACPPPRWQAALLFVCSANGPKSPGSTKVGAHLSFIGVGSDGKTKAMVMATKTHRAMPRGPRWQATGLLTGRPGRQGLPGFQPLLPQANFVSTNVTR